MFILSSLDLVSQDEMNRILEMFESADTAHDGVLNIQVCFPQTFPQTFQHAPILFASGSNASHLTMQAVTYREGLICDID
jgi:hypothetical protein